MKVGETAGLDGTAAEVLTKGGEVLVKWLRKIFKEYMSAERGLNGACIVPIYKGEGKKNEYTNYRWVNFFNIQGKGYGRVIIERVVPSIRNQLRGDFGDFRKDRMCAK